MKKLTALLLMCLAILPTTLAHQEEICIYPVDGQGNAQECYHPHPQIDVAFVIDSTGSMQDEIRQVKTHIKKIINEVESGNPRPDIRVAIITYRDHSPEDYSYTTLNFGFEENINQALRNLEEIQANGGGDHPEAVADGLNEAINNLDWRDYSIQQYDTRYQETQKLIFLIGDAAPHGVGSTDQSFEQGCPEGLHYEDLIHQAQNRGITIHTVSGSGIDNPGIRVWKNLALETGGEYFKLSYQRVDVDQYYREEGLPSSYATEAKTDSDYDRSTNTISVNPFASFGSAKLTQAAESAGVTYDDTPDKPPKPPIEEEEEDWLNPITGHVITDPEKAPPSKLSDFMRAIFSRVTFWK